LRGAVEQLAPEDLARGLVFAYEPVWAIGTGSAAMPDDAVEAAGLIRECLPPECRGATRVLYGGSVKSSNVAGFMGRPEVDGVLVGGASLNGKEFALLALAGLKAAENGR
jgi:triosephosphate isomerase